MNKRYLRLMVLLVLSVWLVACTTSGDSKGYRDITPQELAEMNDVFLIDTNPTTEERIPGTDAHIPFEEVAQHADELPTDKSTPVAVYCTNGGRSSTAAKKLVELGYTNVLHLDGGINAWKKAGFTVE